MRGKMTYTNTTENVVYREVQRFRQVWIWLLVILVAGIFWYGFLQSIFGALSGGKPAPDIVMWIIFGIAFGIGLPLFIYAVKLIVEVREGGIHIGFFPLHSRIIPFGNIKSCEVRQYRPIGDYGGWGIRWGFGKGWAYNVSGNRGVQLELADGKRLLIGSRQPEELARAIQAKRDKQSGCVAEVWQGQPNL
jgi:hypothetical protein